MQPVLQRHAQPVPLPNRVDPVYVFPQHSIHPSGRLGRRQSWHASQSPLVQRPFPIRTARPQLQVTASSASLPYEGSQSEHHLRRKTPNGTLDAAYDGSYAAFSTRAPPLKHLVLPAQSTSQANPYSLPCGFSLPRSHEGASQGHQIDQGGGLDLFDSIGVSGSNWNLSLQQPSPSSFPHGVSHDPQNVFQPIYFPSVYEPPMQAHDYNVRAYCPPPLPMNESVSFGNTPWHWQKGPMPWYPSVPNRDPMGPPLPYPYASSVPGAANFQHVAVGHMSGIINKLHLTPSSSNMHIPVHGPGSSVTVPFSASPPIRLNGHIGQPQFKEKVLIQAYNSYISLVAYLQASRRLGSTKRDSAPNRPANGRLMIYPKPPKPPSAPSAVFRSSDCAGGHRGAGSVPGAITPFITHPNTHPAASMNGLGHHGGTLNRQSWHGSASSSSYFIQNTLNLEKTSPVATAQSSLEVLESLCEQSDWNWIDGVLLAGCLHYGLERFEPAKKLFWQALSLDSTNVEALTNLGAALYCLDKQEEAEKMWLDAVKMRPSYLEAAEHLVALLYKKRCSQAVEMIEYVQDALRISSTGMLAHATATSAGPNPYSRGAPGFDADFGPNFTHRSNHYREDSTHQAGFGSSGYAIPGIENGRMLALVHAKGTMLYGLKDVRGASASFEEAVMISVGRRVSSVEELVRAIQAALSPPRFAQTSADPAASRLRFLLLPPEKAVHTARLLFANDNGILPGLKHVEEGPSRKVAVQTTSNSLLSLAKIFQDSTSSSGNDCRLLRQPPGIGDILALYYLSLSLQGSPSTANNVGILLAGLQHLMSASIESGYDATSRPSIPGIMPGSGLALALSYYHYGLRLDPKHVHLHTNLGSLLKDIGQLDLAIQMYERAVSCDDTFDIALTNLANAVKDRGRIQEAISYYKRAVKANPNFAEAVCGLLTALNSVCDWRGRGGVILESAKYDRWHVDETRTLIDARSERKGSGLTQNVVAIVAQQLHDASRWGSHILQDSLCVALADKMQHLCRNKSEQLTKSIQEWKGRAWEGSRLVRLVERAIRVAMRQWYQDRYMSGKEKPSRYRRPRLPQQLSIPSAPTVLPFHTFTTPLDAKEIRMISQRNAMRISTSTLRSPWLPSTVYPPPPPPKPHLNIGYVSSDFNNHPLAHLMQSVFGFHNTKRARAFCYATTASDKSSHRLQIEREAPVFRDASTWSAEKLVQQIVRDEIHILVNLNGYTRGARNEIFAARPAPIQMSFMGFAGSLGAEWCDYLLADTTAVPPETLRPYRNNVAMEDLFEDDNESDASGWVYSENIVYCRDTFFCCDHKQSCDPEERSLTWPEEEERRWKMRKEIFPCISDDTIILANFNQLYKIEPTTFRSWLRILERVPKAVLWLLRFPEQGEANLRETALAWAGAEVASRLLFTDVAPKSQHISRARVCDLFLDTPECNAHTTAADVLWSSTPLLTLPRYSYKMCSRMAASILKGALPKSDAGLRTADELIASDEGQYEKTAITLTRSLTYECTQEGYGRGQGRLADMRRLLWDHKWSCGLFDTHRWVSDLEDAYEEVWRRWVRGEGGDVYL